MLGKCGCSRKKKQMSFLLEALSSSNNVSLIRLSLLIVTITVSLILLGVVFLWGFFLLSLPSIEALSPTYVLFNGLGDIIISCSVLLGACYGGKVLQKRYELKNNE